MGAAQHHRAHSASLTIWSSPRAQLQHHHGHPDKLRFLPGRQEC